MTQITAEELKSLDFSQIQGDEPIAITSKGRAVAVLLTPELMEAFEDYLEARSVEREIQAAEIEGAIPWNDAKKQLGI